MGRDTVHNHAERIDVMKIPSGIPCERSSRSRIRIVVCGLALAMILLSPESQVAVVAAADPQLAELSAEPAEASVAEASKRKKRRHQRAARKRNARPDRPARPAQTAEQAPQATEPVYGRLQLNGSFSLELGGTNVVHGEGSTTIELDRATVEKLAEGMEQNLNKALPALSDWLQVIETLPQTLESTSQILNRLTDPKTQQQLQQVEQLLRLLPRATE